MNLPPAPDRTCQIVSCVARLHETSHTGGYRIKKFEAWRRDSRRVRFHGGVKRDRQGDVQGLMVKKSMKGT